MNFAFANRTREMELSHSTAESDAFVGLPSHAERQLATRLVQELAAGTVSVRLRAAARLVDVAGPLAVPALVAILDEPGDAMRATRAELVSQMGRAASASGQTFSGLGPGERASIAAAYEVARRLQGDRDALVRAAAVEAAVRLGSNDAAAMRGALLEALDDVDPRVRRRAALCAASTRGLDPGELLLPLVEDPDRQCRRLAVVALGSTAAPEAADALLLALLDDDAAVRAAAEGSARRLFGDDAGGLEAMPPLKRGRAVARLRAQLAANQARGRLVSGDDRHRSYPWGAMEQDVRAAVAEQVTNSVLDQLLAEDEPEAVAPWTAARELTIEPTNAGVANPDVDTGSDEPAEFMGAAFMRGDADSGLDDYADIPDATSVGEEADFVSDSSFAADALLAEEVGPSPGETSELGFREIEGILRAALRGVDDATLAAELGYSPLALGPVLEEHLESGRIIRRGKKLFLP